MKTVLIVGAAGLAVMGGIWWWTNRRLVDALHQCKENGWSLEETLEWLEGEVGLKGWQMRSITPKVKKIYGVKRSVLQVVREGTRGAGFSEAEAEAAAGAVATRTLEVLPS
jgi:hypothetical protein